MNEQEKKELEITKRRALLILGFRDLCKENFFDHIEVCFPAPEQTKMMLVCLIIDKVINSKTNRYLNAIDLSKKLLNIKKLLDLNVAITDIEEIINSIPEPKKFSIFYKTEGSKLKRTLKECLNKYYDPNLKTVKATAILSDFCVLYAAQIDQIQPENVANRNRIKSARK